MPQLPSGIHAAVDTAPLQALIEDSRLGDSMHLLDRLKTVDDLLPLTRILELVPTDERSDALPLVPGSLQPPPGMTARDTGCRLRDCPDGLPTWSEADRAVFQVFVTSRVMPMLAGDLEKSRTALMAMTKSFLQKVESAWLKAGVHPSQEPGWDDWPQDGQIDVFDQLVALTQCRDAIAGAPGEKLTSGSSVDRLTGFMAMAAGALAWLPKSVHPESLTLQVANTLRAAAEPGAFPSDRRDWWVSQTWIECNNLFDDPALESFLMTHAPKAYGVIRLAAISKPEDMVAT
jgi:hypothetical protein